ncbi:hypothetical protein [Actinomadura sp. 9N407]|uniref:hypothetical protein n=1 Tax=Actinomadura sp. 9N407 TaxID=3375154 RepID=UPI0037ADE2D2
MTARPTLAVAVMNGPGGRERPLVRERLNGRKRPSAMKARPVLIVAAVLLVLATACTEHDPRGGNVRLRQVFALAIGDTARLQGTGLTVTLRGVRDDSRCPEDVDCGWAGDATVIVAVTDGRSAPAEHEFHTYRHMYRKPQPSGDPTRRPDPDGRSDLARIDGYDLHFAGLGPPRKSDDDIEPGDYRARFAMAPAARP